ncbi:MAG: DNA alkylation repair protein [Burkholderiaceae bacterium]
MPIIAAELKRYDREVTTALKAIGNAAFGKAVQADRGSQLTHLGISFPVLRARVKQGFSFYALDDAAVLHVWDALWHSSPLGEVLFAALEFYAPRLRKNVSAEQAKMYWPVMRTWSTRIDNWCHADALSALYSRLLAADQKLVLPQLQQWNREESEWLRRISLVSLIHYSGKNAVFLPPEKVLPQVARCVPDHRRNVETAVGWVLREMVQAYPQEITQFIEQHAPRMSAAALSRATEKMSAVERGRLRGLRKSSERQAS